jgi:iron complex outermembrane recepter protein
MVRKQVLIGASAAAALLGPALGHAQSAGDTQLDQIVVTAQRREQNLQDVPVSVSAFSAKQLEARQVSQALDLVRMVPNLFGSNNTGFGSANTYYLRGLGSTEQIATIDPPVQTYVDDIIVPRQNVNNYGFFDIERIEVLRGPQGTTFGRNSTGGAISIVTKKPGPDFGGFIQGGVSSFDGAQFRGAINLPVNDKIQTRLNGYYVKDEGYLHNDATGQTLNGSKNAGVRGAVRLLPSDDLTIDLSLEHMMGKGGALRAYAGDRDHTTMRGVTYGGTGDLISDALANRGLHTKAQSNAAVANVEWRGDNITFTSLTGYRWSTQTFVVDFSLPVKGSTTTPTPFYLTNDGTYKSFSQEFKINGTIGDKAKYVTGVYLFTEDNDTLAGQVLGASVSCSAGLNGAGNMTCGTARGFSSVRDIVNTTTSYAAYAQGEYQFTDKLTGIVGARFTNETKKVELRATPYGGMTTADLAAAGVDTKLKANVVTPKFGLNYKIDDDKMLYVSATRGYKSGGWNTRTAYTPQAFQDFKPEYTWSYEGGLKSEWLENRLRFNATAFYATTKGLQLSYTTPGSVVGTTLSTQDNAGDIEVKGVELELFARPARGLDLYATAGLQEGKYTYVNPRAQSFTNSVTGVYVNAIDPSDELSRFPKQTVAVGATYTLPVAALAGSFTGNIEANYTGKFWTTASNSAPSTRTPTALNSQSDAYTLLNMSLAYNSDNGDWSAALACKNCTDKVYIHSVFNGYYYGDPRRVTFSVTRHF